ncbi:MAG: nucleotide sugar dehydrogenase [Rhodospirillales bacterium]|nr:nucleotide sugar dehydrogenase [Rhodospirillales bacterium]
MKDTKTAQKSSLAGLSIFGLGYVGAVSTACFSEVGHRVIGVDPDQGKVDVINAGKAPIVEKQLPELLAQGVGNGLVSATGDVREAVLGSDISFVCVGTPSAADGSCDLKYLEQVSAQIGNALREKADYHVIVFRSTVPPGTTRDVMLPIIEKESGKRCGADFGLCFHPEFLRESTAVADFFDPPKTVVGGIDERSSEALAALYDGLDDHVIHTTVEAAEMVKYVDNTWHALKVSFANEVGKICRATNVDSHEVMDIFVQDTKLNISAYYMKPGFAFGGSCLPKDVRGINRMAQKLGVETPIIGSIIASNQAQIEHAVRLVKKTGGKRIGFLGLTFKADTDDLRESPVLPVIAELLADGRDIRIFDPNLNLDASVRHHLQHSKHAEDDVGRLMRRLPELVRSSASEVCAESDTIVIAHADERFREATVARRADQKVVDLVRVYGPDGAWEQMRSNGMNDYVQKPVDPEKMFSVLSEWTGDRKVSDLRILIAEDDSVTRKVASLMLKRAGLTVDTVADGAEAVHAVRHGNYDAVLMDVTMPKMNGMEATSAIRRLPEDKRSIPVIAMTAHAKPETSSTYNGICW